VDKVSQESGIDVRLLKMLVNACKAVGLLSGEGEALKNSPEAERFLVKGRKSYIGDFILLIGEEYYDVWRGLKEVIVTGRPVRDDRMVRLSKPRYAEDYIRAMQEISHGAAANLAEGLKLPGKKLLEVGGGSGIYSIMLTKKNPGLKATVFDSPFSCDFANRAIKDMGAKNVETQPGDFEKGSIPKGHDIIMLTYVLQGLAPDRCEALLKRVYEALPRGGAVVVNEFLLEGEGTSPVFSSLFALNAFMLSNGGSLHTQDEISVWLTNVGFKGVEVIKTSSFIVSLSAKR
jgi:hypothetical protein